MTQLNCLVGVSFSVWHRSTSGVAAFSTTVELSPRSWEDKDVRRDSRVLGGRAVAVYQHIQEKYSSDPVHPRNMHEERTRNL